MPDGIVPPPPSPATVEIANGLTTQVKAKTFELEILRGLLSLA
jgi:hypothetical protein